VGAVPVKEGTGRIARFELLPLSEMGGRPRVDCLCNMSGIFRDAFQNVVELLDDLFARAAAADEPPELNFIRKHATAMSAQGITQGNTSRLFSNPAGDYGSMVNERVGASNWNSSAELGDTWAARNSYSYGRGGERGVARPEVLQVRPGEGLVPGVKWLASKHECMCVKDCKLSIMEISHHGTTPCILPLTSPVNPSTHTHNTWLALSRSPPPPPGPAGQL
jgi:hypothetical protein